MISGPEGGAAPNAASHAGILYRLLIVVALSQLLAAIGSYLISASLGHVPWCWPMLEGCTSISRAARTEPAIFWFRLLMLPNASLLPVCWWLVVQWLRNRGATVLATRWVLGAGVVGALALALYVDFLGSTGPGYQFMRRFGITFYFAGTGLAQLLTMRLLRQQALQQQVWQPPPVLPLLWHLMLAQWSLALLHVVLKSTLADYDLWENRLEWTLALLMTSWFAVLAEQWRRERVDISLTTGKH